MVKRNSVPEYARELVTRGLDSLAERLDAARKKAPGSKLAKMWKNLSEEERREVGAGIVAVATAAAAAIPMTMSAIRNRKEKAKATEPAGKKQKKDKKKKKQKKH